MFKVIHPNRWFFWTIAVILIVGLLLWWAIQLSIIQMDSIQTLSDIHINHLTATSTVTLDTSTWKTYRNDRYGFEVKYPDYLKFWENPNLPVFEFGTENETGVSIVILPNMPSDFDFNKFIASRTQSDQWLNRSYLGEIKRGNASGILTKVCGKDNKDCFLIAYFIHNRNRYEIKEGKEYSYFNQILSTFKFFK